MTTEIGKVTIDVPRDRQNTYEPQIVRKHQRRLAGFDEAVISLYAKGMTTGDPMGRDGGNSRNGSTPKTVVSVITQMMGHLDLKG